MARCTEVKTLLAILLVLQGEVCEGMAIVPAAAGNIPGNTRTYTLVAAAAVSDRRVLFGNSDGGSSSSSSSSSNECPGDSGCGGSGSSGSSSSSAAQPAGDTSYPRGQALISAPELRAALSRQSAGGSNELVVLAVVQPSKYITAGRIAGSRQLWRPDYEPPPPGSNATAGANRYPFDGMLSSRAEFQALARRLGVSAASTVVIYDHKYDATRLWWAFFLYGKTDVKVLDGGFGAWVAAGYEIAQGPAPAPDATGGGGGSSADAAAAAAAATAGDWVAAAEPGLNGAGIATMAEVRAATAPGARAQLWDDREDDEWSGAVRKGAAARAGRIPAAVHAPWELFRVVGGCSLRHHHPCLSSLQQQIVTETEF